MLPPGRAKLAIIPVATGSVSKSNATMGMVAVAARTASATGVLTAAITSTFWSTNSIAIGASRVGSPLAKREMNSTSSGTRYPAARNPPRNASIRVVATVLGPG